MTQGPDANKLCENALQETDRPDLHLAFAGMWLDRDLPAANEHLRKAYEKMMRGREEMTPEVADENAKWQMRTWVRLYYLFNDKSAFFPSRLDAENQRTIEELFWNYACAMSNVERARLKYVWFIQGSENHDMMDLVNAFLAVQAIADLPEYRERPLPDGHLPREHVAAWTAYYTRYCDERLTRGLYVEVASPIYGKYMLPELVNMYDFARSDRLRKKVELLLHVTWADWAVDQIKGIRGGGKTRTYQGKYSQSGARDAWGKMGLALLDQGDWWKASRYRHPIMGFNYCVVTSRYRLPQIIADIALSTAQRGEYVYVSRRPGKMTGIEVLPPVGGHPCWYFLDRSDPRLVRYDWCTPDHVIGSFFVDPELKECSFVLPDRPGKAEREYAALSAQNRWQGIVFATGEDARVYPQCLGRVKPGENLSGTDNQHVAVQHRNVMIVQANRSAKSLSAMRVFFAEGMKDRLVEKDGWLMLSEGNSYLAVKGLSRSPGQDACGRSWDDENFVRFDDVYAPVVFVTGRETRFETPQAFADYVLAHEYELADGVLTYRFQDATGETATLTMYVEERRLPEVNGEPIDLAPAKVYDCPYLSSEFGSGVVTVRFGGRELVIDCNQDRVTERNVAK